MSLHNYVRKHLEWQRTGAKLFGCFREQEARTRRTSDFSECTTSSGLFTENLDTSSSSFSADSSSSDDRHSSGPRRKRHRSVTFGSVSIREHARILTEHPECDDGVALGLDWKHSKKEYTVDVDVHERKKRIRQKKTSFRRLSTCEKKNILMKVCNYNENKFWRDLHGSHQRSSPSPRSA